MVVEHVKNVLRLPAILTHVECDVDDAIVETFGMKFCRDVCLHLIADCHSVGSALFQEILGHVVEFSSGSIAFDWGREPLSAEGDSEH